MSTGEPPAQPPRRGLPTGRLEALSDGVFAIAITLLVLDIAVPAHASRDLLAAVTRQWPSYLAYAVSFSTIGALWLGHNAITEYLDRADAAFIRLNLLLLLLVAVLPFPTRLFADYLGEDRPERVAATIYGVSLLVASTLLWVLWRYAVHAHLVRPDMADEEVELLTQRLTPGLGGYVLLIVLGLFVPVIAVIGYLGIALYYVIPFGRWARINPFGDLRRRRNRRRTGPTRP
jgi:TMEM175 potassium channel family protein